MFCANDLQIKSNITSLQLENAINKIKHDHKLKGLGSAFLEAENRYNVNAIILASIACLESGYGTSKLAIEKNNLFGLDASLSKVGSNDYGSGYKTKEECINYAAHRIGRQYIELDETCKWRYVNAKDIYSVGKKWCVTSGWADKVISIANKIQNNIIKEDNMKVLVMAGHTASGNRGCGAVGHIDESVETRKVAPKVVEYLKQLGVDATYVKLDKAASSSYLAEQVKLANSKGKFDCMVQIHFNAGSSDPNSNTTGTETYYRTSSGKVFSDRVNTKLSTLFKDRGSKKDTKGLYWLKNTNSAAILIELCFVDDKDDCKVYQNNFDKICRLIAEGLANKTLPTQSISNTSNKYANGSYDRKARVTTNLNVRKDRGTSFEVITTIPKGTIITVNYCLNNWFSTYSTGTLGYISGDYIELI